VRAVARVRRRRTEPRRRGHAEPLGRALDILELLASRPEGLTILELAARLDCPATEVVSTIAIMQRRQWLRTNGQTSGITLGDRMIELSKTLR
jgi:DNA-binding IclR family transcriptional regulator